MTIGFANNSTIIMPLSGSGAPTMTPSFICQQYTDTTKGSIYTATGTSASTDWKETYFPASYITRKNGCTRGSSNTYVVIYGTAIASSGSDITYVNSATAGDSFTINTSGIYSISANGLSSTGTANVQINIGASINNGGSGTAVAFNAGAANFDSNCSWTGYIASGQKVWVWIYAAPTADVENNRVSIARVA